MDATNLEGLNVNLAGLTVEEVDVWQVGSEFGTDTLFFTDKDAAEAVSQSASWNRHAGVSPRKVLRLSDGRALLYHPDPIILNASVLKLLRENAMKKLTDGEKEALGLLGDTGTEAAQ